MRRVNYSIIDRVTAPTLIGHTKKLILRAKAARFSYLPNDVMWWARLVSDESNYGEALLKNVEESMPAGYAVARRALSTFNFSDNESGLSLGQVVKRRIFNLYVRLVVYTYTRMPNYSTMRQALYAEVRNRRTAFFDVELLEIHEQLAQAVTAAAQAYALSVSSLASDDFRRLDRLRRSMEQFLDYASTWTNDTSFFVEASKQIGDADTAALARSRAVRLVPTANDAVADVLAFLFMKQWFVPRTIDTYSTRIDAIFRDYLVKKLRTTTLSGLIEWLTGDTVHDQIQGWTFNVGLAPQHVYKFCAYAVAVLMELQRYGDDIVSCYMHIIDKRFEQLAAPEDSAFTYPKAVSYALGPTVHFEFMEGHTYYVKRSDFNALEYKPNSKKVLGRGSNGAVFPAQNDDRIVVKLTNVFMKHEYDMQVQAAREGFGPQTYAHVHLKDVINMKNGALSFGSLYFVAGERMEATMEKWLTDAKTLDESIAITDAVIKFLKKVARRGDFVHHDMKTDNIMTVYGGDPKKSKSWRVIDYGFAWYGGRNFDKEATVASEECTPYGWNKNTLTLEKPGDVYGGWIRTAPPVLLPSWDVFCMLLLLNEFAPHIGGSPLYRMHVREEMRIFTEENDGIYTWVDEDEDDGENATVVVTLLQNFTSYSATFDLDRAQGITWYSMSSHVEHIHERENSRARWFIPKTIIEELRLRIYHYVGTNETEDNAFACCIRTDCDATVKITWSDAQAELEQQIMKVADVPVLFAQKTNVGLINDTGVAQLRQFIANIVVTSGVAHPLSVVMMEVVRDASAANPAQTLKELIDGAFAYARQLEDKDIIHHDLNASTLLYDGNDKKFTMRNFRQAWQQEVSANFSYPRQTRDTYFEITPGVRARAPLPAIMYARLFVSIYRDVIIDRVRELSEELAMELSDYMVETIQQEYLSTYAMISELSTDSEATFITLIFSLINERGESVETAL